MYKVMRPPVSVPSQGSGSCTSSAQEEVIGDGTSKGGMCGVGGSGSTGGDENLDWSKGRFAAFAMPASNPCPLVVGRIKDIIRVEDGHEAVLHWYSLRQSRSGAQGVCTARQGGPRTS